MKTPMQELFEKIPIDWEDPTEAQNANYFLKLEKKALLESWLNSDGTDFENYYDITYGKRSRQRKDSDSTAGA